MDECITINRTINKEVDLKRFNNLSLPQYLSSKLSKKRKYLT